MIDQNQGHWSHSQIQEFVFSQAGQWRAKIIDNRIAALVLFHEVQGEIDICYLETHHSFRRQGVMQALFLHLIGEFDPNKIWLEVHTKNQGALRFYEKMGFVEQGVRKSYYRDGGHGHSLCWSKQSKKTVNLGV